MTIEDRLTNLYERTLWQNPLQKVVEQYSRKIFPHWAKAVSSFTNRFKINVGDSALLVFVGIPVVSGAIHYTLDHPIVEIPYLTELARMEFRVVYDTVNHIPNVSKIVMATALPFLANGFRKQMFSKLGLEMTPVTKEERDSNIHYCEDMVRGNLDAEKVDEQKTVDTLVEELDRLTLKIEGVKVSSATRIKKSPLSGFFRQLGAMGNFNLFSYEASVHGESMRKDYVIAHELAHGKGYSRESETEFMGYLAGVRSPHKVHRLHAYINRLLREFQASPMSGVDEIKRINSMQLPEDFRARLILANSGGGGGLLSNIFGEIQDAVLRVQGERHGRRAYSKGFTELLTAFERKYGRDGERFFQEAPANG